MRFHPVPDYHMHTPRCNHAVGSVEDYAAAAHAAGLDEIGMSDHSPMPNGFDAAWRMRGEELDDYLREVARARARWAGRLAIRIGLEADFHPGSEDYVAAMIAGYDWDFVIGSVHFIGDWGFDNPDYLAEWERRDIEQAWCDYFELVAASIESDMFDIIGHPDLIKKFGHRPSPPARRAEQAIERMLQTARRHEACLEISSAGLRKPVGEIYPAEAIVARAAALGIPFAFGSDAHAPGEVGHGMDDCLALLWRHGVREIATFENRRRIMRPIRPA